MCFVFTTEGIYYIVNVCDISTPLGSRGGRSLALGHTSE